jgi:hypothetical protein
MYLATGCDVDEPGNDYKDRGMEKGLFELVAKFLPSLIPISDAASQRYRL